MDLIILDETMRDGEQQVGINFSAVAKKRLIKEILNSGIDGTALMPIVSIYERKIFSKAMNNSKNTKKIFASTLLGKNYIDDSFNLGCKKIILFTPLSKRLLKIRELSEEANFKNSLKAIAHARKKGIDVYFAGEDATRANQEYLIKFIRGIEKNIKGFLVCDTVSVLSPKTTSRMIKNLKKNTFCRIGAHFHNDRGMANENTISAIISGAEIISGTFGGIGERAGNADIVDVLFALKKKGIISEKIKYSKLRSIKNLVYRLGGSYPASPYSQKAFCHESGIHVKALIKDPLSYNSFDPKLFQKKDVFYYGKFSGISNYRFLFGNKYSKKELMVIRDQIKSLAYKYNRSFTAREVKKIIKLSYEIEKTF